MKSPFSRTWINCVVLFMSPSHKFFGTFLWVFPLPFSFLMSLRNGWHQMRVLSSGHQMCLWAKIKSLFSLPAAIPAAPSVSEWQCWEVFAGVSGGARGQSCAVNLRQEFLGVCCSVWASDSSLFGKSPDRYSCIPMHTRVEAQCCVTGCLLPFVL